MCMYIFKSLSSCMHGHVAVAEIKHVGGEEMSGSVADEQNEAPNWADG